MTKLRPWLDLILLDIVSSVTVLAMLLLPANALRVVVGTAFLLFAPGFALMAALFVRRHDMSAVARVALSFPGSAAVAAMTGYILNYTDLGIRLEPIVYALYGFVLACSLAAAWRRAGIPEDERYSMNLDIKLSNLSRDIQGPILAFATLLGVVAVLVFALMAPKPQEPFTEFYILGESGEANNYRTDLQTGSESTVTIGIVNHERRTTRYRVVASIGGKALAETQMTIQDEQKWESELSFTPVEAGDYQKLEFTIYRDDQPEPYLEPVYLWVNVRGGL